MHKSYNKSKHIRCKSTINVKEINIFKNFISYVLKGGSGENKSNRTAVETSYDSEINGKTYITDNIKLGVNHSE